MMARRWLILLGLLLALLGGQARADSCTLTASDIVFPSVSSISSSDAFTSSTSWNVTCNWTAFTTALVAPNVTVCLYLGAGTNSSASVTAPRQMANGAVKANYNLYSDTSYAASKIWGGWAGTTTSTTPIILTMTKTGGTGSLSQSFTVYGKLTADATLAANSVGASDITVTSDFGSGSALVQYLFTLLGSAVCTLGPTAAIPFQVRANVINDCNINVGNIAFPNSSLLSSTVRSTSSMSIRCSAGTAYRVLLSYGGNGSGTARNMKKIAGTELVSYQLSNTLDGTTWADGASGTLVVGGTGDGTTVSQTVFGRVPVQSTPSPGDYKDTITATVQF
ncbi:fimbrial major subunit CsuA/B family protein [Duganella sp. FT135W]|uniref:Fimbrial major subunit CsuA/B family protein n=1 Tax=Duganella flavida TaxID=2692175 RepID=A0A6L8K0Z1_9BURK|nr:spore coat U domain-containing protein [Duganella flavida]MYM21169.1 fimbrial major subunit CsuA/B family protein [Duganella flavida]